MADKPKKMFSITSYWEMKIKTMMRYHYIPTRIAKINFEKEILAGMQRNWISHAGC